MFQFFCLVFLETAAILCGFTGGDAFGASNETNNDAPPGGYVFNNDPIYVKISSSVFRLESSYIFPMHENWLSKDSSKEKPHIWDTLTLMAVLPTLDHINRENESCFKIQCSDIVQIRLQNSPNGASPKTLLERMLEGKEDIVENDHGLERHIQIGSSDISYYTYSDQLGVIHFMYCGLLECGASVDYKGGALVSYYFNSSKKYNWKEIDRQIRGWLDKVSVK